MTSTETPGTVLALQEACRMAQAAIDLQNEYIRRLEQAVKDLLGLIQKGHIANSDLPMLDLIHQLLDGEQDR